MFKKMLAALGVGGPSVETVLNTPHAQPGGRLEGIVRVEGGSHASDIEYVALGLVTRVETESGDHEMLRNREFARQRLTGPFHLPAGGRHEIPFSFAVPHETPITELYGQRLHGMTMNLRTELEVARAVDGSDSDPVAIHPLPAQQKVLEALLKLGFRFSRADVEEGSIYRVQQSLPFYQEIEFWPPAQYARGINQLEVTFVATPHVLQIVLEADKRGGLLSEGHDAFGRFEVDYATAERTDWAAQLDAWLRQAAQRRGLFF